MRAWPTHRPIPGLTSGAIPGRLLGLLPSLLSALLLLSLSGCGYKSLQQQDEDVRTSWSEVVSQYQRRADLISGLAGSLQDFADPCARTARSESDLGVASRPHPTCDTPPEQALIRATEASARSGALPAAPALLSDPAAFTSYQAMQDRLTRSLQNLLGVSAAYPQLQADPNFLDLRTQLAETEERIDNARHRYMQAVQTFNASVRTFPTDLTARMFDYQPKPSFPSGQN